MGSTTRGYTYPESTDHNRLWEHFETLAEDIDGDVGASFGGITYRSTAPASPLISTANTDASILSGAFTFRQGYAYQIEFSFRWSLAGLVGANVGRMFPRLRRATTAGTEIWTGGYILTAGGNVPSHASGFHIVKRTGADTTQTVVLIGNYSTTNSPTSMAIDAGSVSPTVLTIRCIGSAASHSNAPEIPTS